MVVILIPQQMQPGQQGVIQRARRHLGPGKALSDQRRLSILSIELCVGKWIDFKIGRAWRRGRISGDDRLTEPKNNREKINQQRNPFSIYLRSNGWKKYTDADHK